MAINKIVTRVGLSVGVALVLCGGKVGAAEEWFVPGEEKSVEGRLRVDYPTLPPNTNPDSLLDGYVIGPAPHGIVVKTVKLNAQVETNSLRSGRKNAWKYYAIDGVWSVAVPDACPAGDHVVTVSFPAVDRLRGESASTQPGRPSSLSLTIKVFASPEKRAEYDRAYNANSLIYLGVLAAGALAMLGGIIWYKRHFG